MSRNFVGSSTQFLSNNNAVVTGVPFTMACWIKPNSLGLGGTQGIMSISASGSNDNHWLLGTNTTDNIIARARTTTQTSSTSTGVISSGIWFHVGAIYTSATSRNAVLNGVIDTVDTVSKAPASVNLTQIGRQSANTVLFDGFIAEAAIWNVALVANDFSMLYKGFSPLLVKPRNLVAYWPLIGRASPEQQVAGYGGTGNFPMYLNNAPAVAEHPRMYRRG